MKLNNFSLKATKELVEYSHWLPSAIALFNREYSQSIGTILQVPCCVFPVEEDRLSYWDDINKTVVYGRYLLFKNTKWEIIEFWTGFTEGKTGTKSNYIVLFDEKDPFSQYKKNLKKSFTSNKSENGEFQIPIKSTDITSETVVRFWHSILKELN
jgi:hypothetical protein